MKSAAAVRSCCPFVEKQAANVLAALPDSLDTPTVPASEPFPHRRLVSTLVDCQQRLRALPAAQCTEVLQWGVLHLRGKLPPEAVPAPPQFWPRIASLTSGSVYQQQQAETEGGEQA